MDTIFTILQTRRSEHEIRVSGKKSRDDINDLEQEIIQSSTIDEAVEALRSSGASVISYDGNAAGRDVDYEIELSTTRHAKSLPLGKMPLETVTSLFSTHTVTP